MVGKQGRENRAELPLVRVRVKYQSVQILPLELYHDFTEVRIYFLSEACL